MKCAIIVLFVTPLVVGAGADASSQLRQMARLLSEYFNLHFAFLAAITISGVEPRVRNFLLSIRLLGWKPRTWFEGDH